jgi:hypothetical protein
VLASLVAVALAGYGWWATSLAPARSLTRAAILIPGLVLIAVAPKASRGRLTVRRRIGRSRVRLEDLRRRDPAGPARWVLGGLVAWVAVLGATIVWQLVNFFLTPRSEHPTISSILNTVNTHPVRLLIFLGWLALGWDITRR